MNAISQEQHLLRQLNMAVVEPSIHFFFFLFRFSVCKEHLRNSQFEAQVLVALATGRYREGDRGEKNIMRNITQCVALLLLLLTSYANP